ncbi:glycosyltransferase [Hymenobacter sp. ASUV-10]|uniref:Glycosyltransferase n=1 Tax=Hymenobacter aranciens TaxID=3063996 RepID=A0ABT9B5U6_9BACT|nr:glycosyltransferase [Hymenobacter sp. ASUV-10]MDO7873590.1 glycosyltransferase [Hymenobacter sp. ASUV-10]
MLASVLKPVDDTRMRGKFAETLRERPGTTVHVAGRQACSTTATPGVHQHSIFAGTRTSLARLAAQWRYWQLLRRLRPDLVIVHAPELLPLTLLWQRLGHGRKFLYDIRENYALNIATQGVYQGLVRRWLAAGLRRIETWAARRASGLLLAEESYAEELPFLQELPPERVAILENKYQPAPGETLPTQPRPHPAPHEPLRLLFSGTISALNGVWEAVAFTRALAAVWPSGVHCTIIGFCQQPELLQQLQEAVNQRPELFTLIGGAEPVPHAAIVAEIERSHVGLLAYQPHPSTERCRPTKLFEYLAHGLPMLIPPNQLWYDAIALHKAGLLIELADGLGGAHAAAKMQAHFDGTHFYPNGLPKEALWASEGKKLWRLLDSIF